MTKKKLNLHEKLKNVTKGKSDSSFGDKSFSAYPPIIERAKAFDFNYNINEEVVTPPIFNKEKFQIHIAKNSESKVETVQEQEINSTKSEIITLKKIRKKDYDSLEKGKSNLESLENIHEDILKKHSYENEKNSNFRQSLLKVKEDVSRYSKSIDSLKNDKNNLHIENTSLERELLRLEERREESESLISSLSKDNAELVEKLANIHRDINEVDSIYKANVDLIDNYKKQIVVNKENINSLINDIEFKNKEVDQKNENIELLREDIEESRSLELKISTEVDLLKVELSKAESLRVDLKEQKEKLLSKISKLESESKEYGYRKSELFKEFKEKESLLFNLSEDIKSIKSDIYSKKSIVDSHESKIFQIQKNINEYENHKSDLIETLIKRKQEIHKYTKVFELKSSKLDQLENENFNLKREVESLLSALEEGKIQRDTISRKMNQLTVENTKSEAIINSLNISSKEISKENEQIDLNIVKATDLRTLNLERISNLRSVCDRTSKSIEYKQIQLGNIQSNVSRQTEQVLALKVKRDERSDKLESLTNSFNECRYKIKQTLKEKRFVSKEIDGLNSSIAIAQDKNEHYQILASNLKTEKLKKFDEKISLEKKINVLMTSLQESESEVYTEKSIISTLQGELDDVLRRTDDLKKRLNTNQSLITSLRSKKSELSEFTNKSILNKNELEEELINTERVKGSLESEIIRDQEISSDLSSKLLSVDTRLQRLNSTIEEYKEHKEKLISQIKTREELISSKEEESISLSKMAQRLDLELNDLTEEFKKSNSVLIDSNLSVTSMKEEIRIKKTELASAKEKYQSLANKGSDISIDKEQQLVLIDELEKTKSRYLSLIDDLMGKNLKEQSGIEDRNRYIENLQKDIDTMKSNVHVLNNYKKKKVA